MNGIQMLDAENIGGIEEVPFKPAVKHGNVALIEARIAELAKLSKVEYETIRIAEAETLKLRVSVLDEAVETARPIKPAKAEAEPFEVVELWSKPVNGAALLDELQGTIERFCVLPEHSAPLMAAWVLHAWAHDASDISPVLAFVSPEKRCGKTTALSVIGALVPSAMHAANVSLAVLFRVVEKYKPTVLIDEADTFLEANSELCGVLNSGHNRSNSYVWRTVGDDYEPRPFTVWSPKCIAMIGRLPDTLEDRALVVRLRRKEAGETVERFRADRINDFLDLRRMAARWANDNLPKLRSMDPDVPATLNDRAQDNARAICAIADAAGGKWPKAIRSALVGMAAQAEDEPQSSGVMLLRDIAKIFEERPNSRIGSTELCDALRQIRESPWSEWRGGLPISTRGVAKLLKPFGIKSVQDHHGSFYRPMDFTDAFNRYLPVGGEKTTTNAASATQPPSATQIVNKINNDGTCDDCGSCFEKDGNKCQDGAWEGELCVNRHAILTP